MKGKHISILLNVIAQQKTTEVLSFDLLGVNASFEYRLEDSEERRQSVFRHGPVSFLQSALVVCPFILTIPRTNTTERGAPQLSQIRAELPQTGVTDCQLSTL